MKYRIFGLIVIVFLATSTIGILHDKMNFLVVENENLEDDVDRLQSQVDVLEIQRDNVYDGGYLQGVNDGVARSGFNIRDPTYREVINFITLDQTDKNEYDIDAYNCFDFTADVEKNAFEAGYRAGFVYIEFLEDSAHSIIAFNTIDRGLTYIEPQDDEIVTLNIGQSYWDRIVYGSPDYDDTIIRFVVIW